MILAANDVGDREITVVHGRGEVECRPAIRADEHEVGDLRAREAHGPTGRVDDDDLGRRDTETDDVRLTRVVTPLCFGARDVAATPVVALQPRAGRSSGRRAPWPATRLPRRRGRRDGRSAGSARPRTPGRATRGRRGFPARRPLLSGLRRCRRCGAAALRPMRVRPGHSRPPPRRSRGAAGRSATGRSAGGRRRACIRNRRACGVSCAAHGAVLASRRRRARALRPSCRC